MEHHLFPDTTLLLSVEVTDVVKRLLPTRLDRWKERCKQRRGQMQLLKELRSKIRVREICSLPEKIKSCFYK